MYYNFHLAHPFTSIYARMLVHYSKQQNPFLNFVAYPHSANCHRFRGAFWGVYVYKNKNKDIYSVICPCFFIFMSVYSMIRISIFLRKYLLFFSFSSLHTDRRCLCRLSAGNQISRVYFVFFEVAYTFHLNKPHINR